MKNKWQKFHSTYSPIKAADIDTGAHNLQADWTRLVRSGQGRVNGRPMIEFAQPYMEQVDGELCFKDNEALNQFFSEVLLIGVPNSEKKEAIEYLSQTFHQGGLMYPVSTPFSDLLKNHKGQSIIMPASSADKFTKSINILTTDDGFKIQEQYTVKEVLVTDDDPESPFIPKLLLDSVNDVGQIFPDKGKDYIISAQATVDIDFSSYASKPQVTVESNSISFGSKAVEKVLDNRNLGQIIVDFLKRIVGLNKVRDLSDLPEVGHEKADKEEVELSNMSDKSMNM